MRLVLSVTVLIVGLVLLARGFRGGPQAGLNLLMGVGFTLSGGSDFLTPLSASLATAVDVVGVLCLLAAGAKILFFSDSPTSGKTPG